MFSLVLDLHTHTNTHECTIIAFSIPLQVFTFFQSCLGGYPRFAIVHVVHCALVVIVYRVVSSIRLVYSVVQM